MKIGIIDADLIGRKRHRFPNLCSMKISSYHKKNGNETELLLNYQNLDSYDKIYVSKVFTDTYTPDLLHKNIYLGGTGFFFDQAEPLPYEIEHCKPDYDLYNKWLESKDYKNHKNEYKEYTDYSIGYLTRGCFRKCKFCVNQKYNHVFEASQLEEFLEHDRKKIILNDDNFFGYQKWKILLQQLIDTNKPFKFKQGLDLRLVDDEKAEMLLSAKYDGDIYFAFDNVDDSLVIEEKIKLLRQYTEKQFVFYVFCGFDRENKYDQEFFKKDILDVFKRIVILGRYGCLPYIMRHKNYESSPYRGIYILLARWCNQFQFFKKQSLQQFVEVCTRDGGLSSSKYLNLLKTNFEQVYKLTERCLFNK